jgi:flagellar basal-body rod protein FlgB
LPLGYVDRFLNGGPVGAAHSQRTKDVNEISDSAVIAALRRQMTVAVAKQVAAAGNLANVDTPGFKAKEISFDETLSQSQLTATKPRHFGSAGPATGVVAKEFDGPARRDGNTVQLDHELLTMGKAAGDFAAAQTALAAKFRLVRYAINEGK